MILRVEVWRLGENASGSGYINELLEVIEIPVEDLEQPKPVPAFNHLLRGMNPDAHQIKMSIREEW